MHERPSSKLLLITRSGIAIGVLLVIAGLILRDTTVGEPVDLPSLGLYLEMAGALLSIGCTVANYRSIMRVVSRNKPVESANTVVICGLAILLTGLICFISIRRYIRLDWTGNRFYSLHSRTRRMLEHLDDNVDITIIYQEPDREALKTDPNTRMVDWGYKQSRQMLDEFDARSSHISVRTLDLSEAGEVNRLAERYDLPGRCVLLETEDSHEVIPFKQVVRASQDRGRQLLYNGEAAFSSAIQKLTSGERQTVYFLTGHGERILGESHLEEGKATATTSDILQSPAYSLRELVSRLQSDNYAIKELNLTETPEVPEDCDVLIVAGPRSDVSSEHISVLQNYLEQEDGRMIVMADSHLHNPDHKTFSLNSMLRDYGIEARTRALGVNQKKETAHANVPVTRDGYSQHPITNDLQNYNLFFMQCAPLEITDSKPRDGLQTRTLLISQDSTWGETDPSEDVKKARYQTDDDIAGPIITAAMCSPSTESPADDETNSSTDNVPQLGLIVFGSSLSFVDKVVEKQTPNLYIMLNSINWLAGREQMVGIPPKSMALNSVNISSQQIRLARWIFLLGLPACIIIPGICVWQMRKR